MRIATPPTRPTAPTHSTYTVRAGDTLERIAQRLLGDGAKWTQLYEANRGVIGKNPHLISVGMTLRLPSEQVASRGEVPIPRPRPSDRLELSSPSRSPRPKPRPAELTPPIPQPRPQAPAPRLEKAELGRWTAGDVDFLTRALSAESRGELSKYLATGDRRFRDAVLGIGYVIAQTAKERGVGIEQLIRRQPGFLSAWGEGATRNNRQNYQQFFLPPSKIAHWNELKAIAREALAGNDPTGIDPNHYYDTSIRAPYWARGAGVESKRIGKIVFVDNTGRN